MISTVIKKKKFMMFLDIGLFGSGIFIFVCFFHIQKTHALTIYLSNNNNSNQTGSVSEPYSNLASAINSNFLNANISYILISTNNVFTEFLIDNQINITFDFSIASFSDQVSLNFLMNGSFLLDRYINGNFENISFQSFNNNFYLNGNSLFRVFRGGQLRFKVQYLYNK